MTSYINNLNNVNFIGSEINSPNDEKYAAPVISNPIETIKEKINEETNKKHNKTAITAGSVVAGVAITVALVNPKRSRAVAEFLRKSQAKTLEKIEKTKNSKFINSFYKVSSTLKRWVSNAVNFYNNINPTKDTLFMNFCTKEKDFMNVKDYKRRKRLQKTDKAVVSVTSKFHRGVTRLFDKIGKHTVKRNYKKTLKTFDKLDNSIQQNLSKLPKEEQSYVLSKLAKIYKMREYYSPVSVESRLEHQAELMKNLERDFGRKRRKYGSDYTNKWVNKGEHLINNMNYWPEEILKPVREKVVNQGTEYAGKIIGNSAERKGAYNEIIDVLSKYLDKDEFAAINAKYMRAEKSMNRSNMVECGKYFDKKRDLTLGSAPTDIVTATLSLMIAGVALASADNKDERISKLVTGIIPAISGVGVSIAMTAALVSGAKGLMIGLLATAILNRIGIVVDKYALGHKDYYMEKKLAKQQKFDKKEIK